MLTTAPADRRRPRRRHEVCPLCAGASLTRRWELNGHTIVRCDGCSLVFVQDVPTEQELADHYRSGGDAACGDDNRDCLDYYYRRLGRLIASYHAGPGRLLDIGCAAGWFLDAMDGWECHGCEVSPDAEAARLRHGDRIFPGRFEDYAEPDGTFDVITLQDVFDHIPDPQATLKKCHRLLKPGGLILIKVHNISCLYAKLSGRSFYALSPPGHLFYYDVRTLTSMLQRNGFEVAEHRFIGHLLRLSTVFMRLSKMERSSVFYRVFEALRGTALGNVKIRKNLRDIITVVAVKPARRPQDGGAPSPRR